MTGTKTDLVSLDIYLNIHSLDFYQGRDEDGSWHRVFIISHELYIYGLTYPNTTTVYISGAKNSKW